MYGVGQLVGLLQGVGDDALLGLLPVPGAFLPKAQCEVVQPAQLLDQCGAVHDGRLLGGGAGSGVAWSVVSSVEPVSPLEVVSPEGRCVTVVLLAEGGA